jgi:hypothetical protein
MVHVAKDLRLFGARLRIVVVDPLISGGDCHFSITSDEEHGVDGTVLGDGSRTYEGVSRLWRNWLKGGVESPHTFGKN